MRYLKVAAVSLNQIPLDWEHNKNNILNAIEKARSQGVELTCFPELCITGYGCEDMFLSISTCQMAQTMLKEIVPETHGMIVAVGLPVLYRDGLYNTACLIVDGEIIGFVAKQNLAGSGVHYEPRWFKAWPTGMRAKIQIEGRLYPLGDLVIEVGDVRIGFEICEDAWVAIRTGVNLAPRGVDIILNPSASHFNFGKSQIRKRFVLEAARAFSVAYLYSNLLGNEAGRIIYDGDTLIAADDKLLGEGPRFSFEEQVVTTAVIDIQGLRMQRAVTVSFPKTEDRMANIIKVPFSFYHGVKRDEVPLAAVSGRGYWENSSHLREEEFSRAVALGLFDYMRKSRSFGFVLNLSGGADSAACATLIYLMVHFALQELGVEGFQRKLSYLSIDQVKTTDIEECAKIYTTHLLFALYQKTKNNSKKTKEAAEKLAETFGFPLVVLNIDTLVSEYEKLMEPELGRPLNWKEDDITLQNIQSRVRAPSAWALANARKAILLTTSNRSEASVGYATMDGDTAGGLAPLCGIDKSFITQWLNWLQTEPFSTIKALSVLSVITAQQPTAELRPLSAQQTDENDLMPYPILDSIERLFVRDKRSPLEILTVLQEKPSALSLQELAGYIERFFVRWAQNQWKRERYAPSFHLDDENVDPKTWCRFPILSGGFKKEIELMWDYVKNKYAK